MIVFGGSGTSPLNDVWSLSLSDTPAWTPILPAGPAPQPRAFVGAIYDPKERRMIVYGGTGTVQKFFDDVWALSLVQPPAWQLIQAAGASPPGRLAPDVVYDPVQQRMVVFGGQISLGSGYINDTWTLSLDATPTWTALAPSGGPPAARVASTAVYDAANLRVIVFGGQDTSYTVLADAWALSLAGPPVWTPLPPAILPALSHMQAIDDPIGQRMVVFGGEQGPTYASTNQTWWRSLAGGAPDGALLPVTDPIPPETSGHSAVYDSDTRRMIVFGGGLTDPRNDTWALCL
jgi:hypothetical protein